ncbi:MAG: hypothetical protein QOG92_1339, partial [Verrucomicrobiota bacterium]|nr:hypothetical protein [Verrucomicrobiota bacterium]
VFLLDKIRIPNKKNPDAKLAKLETVVICPKLLGIFIGLCFLLAGGIRPHRDKTTTVRSCDGDLKDS